MNRRLLKQAVGSLYLLALIATWSGAISAATYSVTDLGALTDPYFSGQSDLQLCIPSAINSSGQIALTDYSGGKYHAYRYCGTRLDLGSLYGQSTLAFGINASGQVVGRSDNTSNYPRAFLWTAAASPQMKDLGTFGGPAAEASGINASGQTTGYATTGGTKTQYDTFRLSPPATITNVGTVLRSSLGTKDSYGYAINDAGKIVGAAFDNSYNSSKGFYYDGTSARSVDDFGGAYTAATAINNLDRIVGYSDLDMSSTRSHAFLYAEGQTKDIGTLGGNYSVAQAINNCNMVVGASYLSDNTTYRAFISAAGAAPVDLTTQLDASGNGWDLREARGINDLGQIVGWGYLNGQLHGWLLSPGPAWTSALSVTGASPLSFNAPVGLHSTPIFGAVDVIKTGSGTLILMGSNTYTGATTIADGALSVGNLTGTNNNFGNGTSAIVLGGSATRGRLIYTGPEATFSRGFVVAAGGGVLHNDGTGLLRIDSSGITGSGELIIDGSADMTIASTVTLSSGGLTKAGSGKLTFSAANSYPGLTTIYNGMLSASRVSGAESQLGNALSAIALGSETTQGTLEYTGSGETISRGLSLGLGGGRVRSLSTGELEITGDVAGNGSLVLDTSGDVKLSGAVSLTGQGGTVALRKTGAAAARLTGQWQMEGGDTVVENGTLQVDAGIHSTGAGTDATTVGLSDGTTTAILVTEHIRQDTLTINANGKVQIATLGSSSGTSVVNFLNIADSMGSFIWGAPSSAIVAQSSQAVPEPAVWLLVLCGVTVAIVAQRRSHSYRAPGR